MENGSDMKKIIYIIFFIILINYVKNDIDNLGSGVGNNDWGVNFNNDYAIWRINSERICFGKKETPYSMRYVVDSYISAFCYNEKYVVLECFPEGKESQNSEDAKREYYIMDLENEKLLGPYDDSEIETNISNIDLGILSDWVSTSPIPKEAVFN